MKLIDDNQFIREDLKHIRPTSNSNAEFPTPRLNFTEILINKNRAGRLKG